MIDLYKTSPEEFEDAKRISFRMYLNGLSQYLVSNILNMAKEYQGTYELMVLWEHALESGDLFEKKEIEKDLLDEIEDWKTLNEWK